MSSRTDLPENSGSSLPADPFGATEFDIETALAQSESRTPFLPREPLAARMAANIGRHHALLMLLCAALLWLIVGLPAPTSQNEFRRGEVATRDVIAPHAALVADHEETNARRRDAAALVPPVYQGDPGAQEQVLSQFQTLLGQPEYAARYSAFELKRIARAGEDAIRAVYRGGQIRSDVTGDVKLAHARIDSSLRASARSLTLSSREYSAAQTLAERVARVPNLVVDQRATQRARSEAQNDVREVFGRVQAGDVLLQAGETVSADNWQTLVALGIVAPRFNLPIALAQLALCGVLVLMAGCYFATLNRSLLDRPASLWLSAMTPVVFLFLFRCILRVPHADFLLIPLAACAAILLTIMLDARPGLMAGFLISALGTLMVKGDVSLFLSALLVAWSGTLSTANIMTRGQLVRAGLLVGAASGVLVGALGLLRATNPDQLPTLMLWSVAAGVLAVLVAIGLAMLLERPFGITTHLRLIELLAPDEAVLRRLQTEAPGTYTHSLMVSMLGEAGANAVGADALLCRVGGLYHDIGKLRRPHCFVENQSGENIHDRITPTLSARLILAHVADGVALGRALKLPQPVLDIIATHHGTSRVEYFYRRAVSENEILDENFAESHLAMHRVNEDDFRYQGPRPQSKEAAIILLADTVEASSRALAAPTLEKLEHHVQAMIGGRLREGELAACDLTLRDLGKIETAFLHVLKGALHQRIAYPDPAHAPAGLNGSYPTTADVASWEAATPGNDAPAEAQQQHDVLWMQEALSASLNQDDIHNGTKQERRQASR